MSDLLEIGPDQLHCCIKVFIPSQQRVETWVRSEPYDDRTETDDPNNPHLISANSVWSALLGESDGKFDCKNPYNTFSCNDLYKRKEQFVCSRKDWTNYYRSTLVFPLRYFNYSSNKKEWQIIGFLTFDSLKENVFYGLPDIFEYRDNAELKNTYYKTLAASSIFHIGAITADTLSMFLRPAYDKNAKKEKKMLKSKGEKYEL